jgi:hypothetical protein
MAWLLTGNYTIAGGLDRGFFSLSSAMANLAW